jgi:hypothetical protein
MQQDGKFKIALIDENTKKEVLLPTGTFLSLLKMSNGEIIPEEEPIWVLRGHDKFALNILRRYISLCEIDNCSEIQMIGMHDVYARFERFYENYPKRMKQPGITKGA